MLITDIQASFLASFVSVEDTNEDFASEVKTVAKKALATLELPTTKWEEWKYTSLKTLRSHTYTAPQTHLTDNAANCDIAGLNGHSFLFVNGFFHSANIKSDDEQLIARPLHALSEEEIAIVEKYYSRQLTADKDIFTAMNAAYCTQMMFIFVPADVKLKHPIHIQHLTDSDIAIAFQHRNLVIVGENASATIIESYHKTGNALSLRNAVTEIYVADDARVDYVKIQDEGNTASHIESTACTQNTHSYAAVSTFTLSGEIVRNNLIMNIEGQNSEAHLYGAYNPVGAQHFDNHTEVHHKVPHCYSNELYKGIINDNATAVFNGKIHVYKDAQKTNAFQSNRNILLSDEANIYTKPQLEIYADDVKCSHGATTGQLNEEALFYMRARGIAENDARKLLVQAFLAEVTDKIENESVRTYVETRLIGVK